MHFGKFFILSKPTAWGKWVANIVEDSIFTSQNMIVSQPQNDSNEYWDALINGRAGKLTYQEWNVLTEAMIQAVRCTPKAPNKWIGRDNEVMENGEEELLSDIQVHISTMFNTNDDYLLKHIQKISTEILKYYPQHIASLSNLGSIHLINNDPQKGLKMLLKAHKLNPKDHIVMFNIARGYTLKGNKKKAIRYYKEAMKYGDQRTRAQAEKEILARKLLPHQKGGS